MNNFNKVVSTNNGNGNKSTELQKSNKNGSNKIDKFSDVKMTMEVDLLKIGAEIPTLNGRLEPDQAELEISNEFAKRMSEKVSCRKFDPSKNIDDQLREEEFKISKLEFEEIILSMKYGRVSLYQLKNEAAKLRSKVPPKPSFPIFVACAGAIVIALTLVPTLHDSIFPYLADDVDWLFSIITGLLFGGLITFSILEGEKISEDKSGLLGRLALIGAIGLSLALGLIRLVTATSYGDYFLAIGFTAIEISAVLLIESVANTYHQKEIEFSQKEAQANEAEALVKNAEEVLFNKQREANIFLKSIEDYIEYVSEREYLFNHKPEFVASNIATNSEEYHKNIQKNKGKILGIND